MLSNFSEKKQSFFDLKKTFFFEVQKKRTFSKGLAHAFGQKMPFSSLLRFGQNKTKKT